MPRQLPPLERQLTRARRRLFIQGLCDALAWGWTIALALSAACLLLDKRFGFLPEAPAWMPWAVPGGAVALGTIVAACVAALRTPPRPAVALTVDERFDLRERVTTLLLLAPDQTQTPAGLALRADVDQHIDKLNVASRFPVRLRWTSGLVPAGVALLALTTLVPRQAQGGANESTGPEPVASKDTLKTKEAEKGRNADPAKKAEKKEPADKKDQEIDPDLKNILRKPRDTAEEVRKAVKELGDLEKQREEQLKEQLARNRNLGEQLRQMDRLSKKPGEEKKDKEGPAKDLQKALKEGNLDKAKQEAENLAKKLEKNELSDKDKQDLQNQLDDAKQKLERLAQRQEKRQELEKLHRDGKLDDDKFKEEMDKLDRDADQLKDLDNLAKELKECKKCMDKGDRAGAAQALRKAAKKMGQLDKEEGDEQERAEQLARQLEDIRDQRNELRQQMSGQQGGQQPGDRRPEKKEGDIKARDSRQRGQLDKKGQFVLEGYAPGQNYKKKKPTEVEGQIKRAAQEGPQALEQERIPKPQRNTVRDYYDNLGDQKTKK
jgi:hypothetical protein